MRSLKREGGIRARNCGHREEVEIKSVALHFIGFRGEEYWSAVRVWGRPSFIHRWLDLRARRDMHPDDVVVFAQGDWAQDPRGRNAPDIDE